MSTQAGRLLQELFSLTQIIHGTIQQVHEDMNKNDDEQIEGLQSLVSNRGEVIEQLSILLQQREAEWTSIEQGKIQQMKEWEVNFQPRLEQIYKAFSHQINRLQQGKQISQHYHKGYSDVYTDGVYFDKRK
jgi:hypothetical protein